MADDSLAQQAVCQSPLSGVVQDPRPPHGCRHRSNQLLVTILGAQHLALSQDMVPSASCDLLIARANRKSLLQHSNVLIGTIHLLALP